MNSAPQTDSPWASLRRIVQEGYASRICRRFVIIAGLMYLIVPNLMVIYDSYFQSKKVPEEAKRALLESSIKLLEIADAQMEKLRNSTSE